MSQNNLKPVKTSQNQPKPAKTTQNQPKQPYKIAQQPETRQHFKIEDIWKFLLAFLFQALSPNLGFWAKKYQLSDLQRNFCLHPIWKFMISNLALFFKNFEPKCHGHFEPKSIKFLILTKFCLYPVLSVWNCPCSSTMRIF